MVTNPQHYQVCAKQGNCHTPKPTKEKMQLNATWFTRLDPTNKTNINGKSGVCLIIYQCWLHCSKTSVPRDNDIETETLHYLSKFPVNLVIPKFKVYFK